MRLLYYPGLTVLGGVETVGVGGWGESRLVRNIALGIAFTQDEHTTWFQAPNKLSDSLGVTYQLRVAFERK